MSKHIVATIDEIPVGGRKIVEIEGKSIGVFNIDGAFFCATQSLSTCRGGTVYGDGDRATTFGKAG